MPKLLLPDVVAGRSLFEMASVTVLGSKQLAGRDCYMVDLGPKWRGLIAFVDVETLLLRCLLRIDAPLSSAATEHARAKGFNLPRGVMTTEIVTYDISMAE